ncbi:MerR family transcriptional regulator [Nocardioides islandensis]|uniref:MerR family transcriptional regulator n=1 Tax=Nocardioides islandensis TaxID=433663 RepID=A0A930VD98_9ACTN|nr:MerR family transcriptional regulator [Nocardioides islandensis]
MVDLASPDRSSRQIDSDGYIFHVPYDVIKRKRIEEATVTATRRDRDPDAALYAISVASDLTGVDAQMLRVYERRGLLTPERTEGGTRRYSERDIDRIGRIVMYLDAGLNLAGIARVLTLELESDQLRDQVRELGGVPRHDR